MSFLPQLRIAVLVNHPPHTAFWPEVKDAFTNSFGIVAPDAQIDFFDPIVQGEYPDPAHYDLIILSGGKGNSLAKEPWILRQLDFVRDTVNNFPHKKIFGICFGHQIIAQALGGKARDIPDGPIAGLVKVDLTDEGLLFFPSLAHQSSYKATQFHVREVEVAPPNFIALAENNEALLSQSSSVLSLQAHPEIDGLFARQILDDDDPTYTKKLTPSQISHVKAHCTDSQDGLKILARVIEWVKEDSK